ncbi:MAG: amidohydrolase [Alistipes sp.]|jgi:predicted TIM-barrel fold metal-dependent hydrolase|nr:amidohydrolase [Alistipes sp.]
MKKVILTSLGLAFAMTAFAQNEPNLRLVDWQPVSQLVTSETKVMKPKFPVIDIHNHLRDLSQTQYYLDQMDEAGVWICIGLDGMSQGDFYREHLAASQAVSAERFHVYFSPDFSRIDEPNFGVNEARRLEEAVRMGVRGVKIFKSLGLEYKDKTGNYVKVDDPRIDPIWAKCGELGIPVMIHVTDPAAFHAGPVDRYNERYDELAGNPEWSFYGGDFYSKEEILEQRNRVIARHPNTIFIGAHVGTQPENLGAVSMLLEQYPNFYIDINARISELGRQPYTARKFMIQYQDRILFGTDTPPNAESYRVYYRFFETDDEYFDPTPAHKLQGRWMIYGLYLPDEVLEKLYNKNALKIMGMFKGAQ